MEHRTLGLVDEERQSSVFSHRVSPVPQRTAGARPPRCRLTVIIALLLTSGKFTWQAVTKSRQPDKFQSLKGFFANFRFRHTTHRQAIRYVLHNSHVWKECV